MGIRKRFWQYVHPPSIEELKEIIDEITESASSGFDFFLLVVLSCSIATMGLLTDSPAMIIGAMLVAPLMSPIIGQGDGNAFQTVSASGYRTRIIYDHALSLEQSFQPVINHFKAGCLGNVEVSNAMDRRRFWWNGLSRLYKGVKKHRRMVR